MRRCTFIAMSIAFGLLLTLEGCGIRAARPPHVPVLAPARLDVSRVPSLPDPVAKTDHRSTATCVISVTVKKSGKVSDVSLARSSGFQTIDEVCIRGAGAVHFFPGTKDGKPYASTAEFSMKWQLDHWEFQG